MNGVTYYTQTPYGPRPIKGMLEFTNCVGVYGLYFSLKLQMYK